MRTTLIASFFLASLFLMTSPAAWADEIEDAQKQITEITQQMEALQAQQKGASVDQRRALETEKRGLFKKRNELEKLVVQLKNKAKSKAHWDKVNTDKARKDEEKAQEKAAEEAAKNVQYTFEGSREELVKQRDEMIPQIRQAKGEEARTLRFKLEAINKKINSMDEQVTSLEEKYKGSDREELRGLLLEAWKKKYPQDEVLKIVFHMADFKRSVEANVNATSIYKTDTSVLAVSVAVKLNDTMAKIYPAYVNRDNLSKSQSIGVDTKGNSFVHKEILLTNLK